ncbi:MAG: hypothetical protein E5W13_12420 [Mesorhizobium sp.]|nr:MAG: hypothetical protein E5W13_12420 [Mesorhizobium sp.]
MAASAQGFGFVARAVFAMKRLLFSRLCQADGVLTSEIGGLPEGSSALTSTVIFASVASSRFVLCDGIYVMDFVMALICANDPPPRRVFCFGAVHGKVPNRNTIPFAVNQIASR